MTKLHKKPNRIQEMEERGDPLKTLHSTFYLANLGFHAKELIDFLLGLESSIYQLPDSLLSNEGTIIHMNLDFHKDMNIHHNPSCYGMS